MINHTKILCFLSDLNVYLFFIGFPLFTTLFYNEDILGSTKGLTIFYYFFQFSISILVLFSNLKPIKISKDIKVFLFFWIIYLIRVFYDFYIRNDNYYLSSYQKYVHIFTIIGTSFFPIISTIFSQKRISFCRIVKWFFYSLIFIITIGVINGQSDVRNDLSIAQNSLSFGFYSSVISIFAFVIFKLKDFKINKLLLLYAFIIGILGIGLAGSRGPFFGFVVSLIIFPLYKKSFKVFIILIMTFILYTIFESQILLFLQEHFNVMYERTVATIYEGDTSDRDYIFKDALNQIYKNPFLGDWHLLYYKEGIGNGAHNIFLDSFMSLGIFFGSLLVYIYVVLFKNSIKLISNNNLYSIIGYLTFLCMVYSITTGGSLIYKSTFNFSFILNLIFISQSYTIKNGEQK